MICQSSLPRPAGEAAQGLALRAAARARGANSTPRPRRARFEQSAAIALAKADKNDRTAGTRHGTRSEPTDVAAAGLGAGAEIFTTRRRVTTQAPHRPLVDRPTNATRSGSQPGLPQRRWRPPGGLVGTPERPRPCAIDARAARRGPGQITARQTTRPPSRDNASGPQRPEVCRPARASRFRRPTAACLQAGESAEDRAGDEVVPVRSLHLFKWVD
jgi:hypothetical protein